ncbi:hypothetical protein SCHPADRAFT_481695 [Schizopora paradoxa]|uniref:F-box domain-containing protein n=1 Tax=Schizopora paradoxa TaxID=27342 RepID=A0A0H2RHZ3_9AGAM|nr:hypothetical protein SCHPADRAFT_481695 [Schizopora paradoxa]
MPSNNSLNLSTLTPEVLLSIFRLVCARPDFEDIENDTDPGTMKLDCISPNSPEITLFCVCRPWRELVLKESSLWTVICLGTPGYDLYQNPEPAPTAMVLRKQKELMKLFVERSNGRPLSFVLRFELEAENKLDREAAGKLVVEVGQLCKRWEFLSARCHANLMAMASGRLFNQAKDRLRQLYLNLTSPTRHPLEDSRFMPFQYLFPMDFQDASQALTKLRIQGGLNLQIHKLWTRRLEVGPIATNLTYFTYQQPPELDLLPMTFNDALTILARCKLLKTFEFAATIDTPFEISIPETSNWDNKEFVLRLGLTRLSLSSMKSLEFGPLLCILDAPRLETLCLKGPFYADRMADEFDIDIDNYQFWDCVTGFVGRSYKLQLTTLHLEGLPLSAESVAGVLDMLPCVGDLKLDGRIFNSHLVARLTWNRGAEKDINLLPNLTSLTVVGCSTTYVQIAELVNMVYSRARCAHLAPIGDKDNWTAQQQTEQGGQESHPVDIDMIYLADTMDPFDVENCVEARHFFFTDPTMMWFVSKGYIDIKIGATE